MSMDLKDKNKQDNFLKTFRFATEGILSCIVQERNMRIHILISILVIVAGILFSISRIEWLLIIFSIAGVLVLEMINTAVERVVDLVTKEYHPLAKQAKDIAAGAVLIYAVISVIVGLIIFLPKIYMLF